MTTIAIAIVVRVKTIERELYRNEANEIKNNNFAGINREKYNIAIATIGK